MKGLSKLNIFKMKYLNKLSNEILDWKQIYQLAEINQGSYCNMKGLHKQSAMHLKWNVWKSSGNEIMDLVIPYSYIIFSNIFLLWYSHLLFEDLIVTFVPGSAESFKSPQSHPRVVPESSESSQSRPSTSHTIRAHVKEVWDKSDKDSGWLSVKKKSSNPQF